MMQHQTLLTDSMMTMAKVRILADFIIKNMVCLNLATPFDQFNWLLSEGIQSEDLHQLKLLLILFHTNRIWQIITTIDYVYDTLIPLQIMRIMKMVSEMKSKKDLLRAIFIRFDYYVARRGDFPVDTLGFYNKKKSKYHFDYSNNNNDNIELESGIRDAEIRHNSPPIRQSTHMDLPPQNHSIVDSLSNRANSLLTAGTVHLNKPDNAELYDEDTTVVNLGLQPPKLSKFCSWDDLESEFESFADLPVDSDDEIKNLGSEICGGLNELDENKITHPTDDFEDLATHLENLAKFDQPSASRFEDHQKIEVCVVDNLPTVGQSSIISITVMESPLTSEERSKSNGSENSGKVNRAAATDFGPEVSSVLKNGSLNVQEPVTAYHLYASDSLEKLREEYDTVMKRLETFTTLPDADFCYSEAAFAGFVAKPFFDRTAESKSELLCLECCLVICNLPHDAVLLAVHKLYSKTCKFISNLRQMAMMVPSELDSTDSSTVNINSLSSGLTLTGSVVQRKDEETISVREKEDSEKGYKEALASIGSYLPADLATKCAKILRQIADPLPEDSLELLGIVTTAEGLNRMATEDNRMDSFRTYPNDLLLEPHIYVRAGLFWTGVGDEMQCFACGKTHSDWKKSTSPLVRHLQISPGCAYMQRSFTPEYLAELRAEQERTPYTPPKPPKSGKSSPKKVAKWLDITPFRNIIENADHFADGQRSDASKYITNILYECVDEELQYQQQIPSTEPEIINMLVEMRNKQKEPVQATSADEGGIAQVRAYFHQELQEASIEVEKQSKYKNTRRQQQQQQQDQRVNNPANINVTELAESMRCKICLDKICSLLLLPCTHIATCAGCGMSQKDCPICRSVIKATVSVKF